MNPLTQKMKNITENQRKVLVKFYEYLWQYSRRNKIPYPRFINIVKKDKLYSDRENDSLVPKSNQLYGPDLSALFETLKIKFASTKSKDTIPQWKTQRPTVTLESINYRTTHVIASILSAKSPISRLRRLEEFSSHIRKYPQAKPHAVKEGAVKLLLNLRTELSDEYTQQVLRETFAMLGHSDPPKTAGIRILSIDGGGMRGIAVLKMLHVLEELTGKKIFELFDFICGVSTGAIITCCMVPPHAMSMEALYTLYRDLSAKVFKQSPLWGTSKLMWSHAYYDTTLWEKLLKEHVKDTTLLESTRFDNSPKICTISTVVNRSRVIPFLFRNYNVPFLGKSEYRGSSRNTMFEAIRASSAAPTIFEEFRINDLMLQDGGILVNNPAAVALHEIKNIWPDENISCVVSCGTGKYNYVQTLDPTAIPAASSWKRIFEKILDSATDTEAVHVMLNDMLPEDMYFRLNPHLTESVAMDEINEEKIGLLEHETDMYCRRNMEKFRFIAKKLTSPRTLTQKFKDYYREKKKLVGPITT